MKKCPIFVHRAFFQKSLCSKNPIWGIFLPKMGHFFVPRGWQPWLHRGQRREVGSSKQGVLPFSFFVGEEKIIAGVWPEMNKEVGWMSHRR